MEHECFIQKKSLGESDLSFDKVYRKIWFPNEVAEEVKKANFLIIPSDYTSNGMDVVFPETTTEFFEYIRQQSNEEIRCDIAISDDNYRKIEKHSALIEVATVIVSSGILPIAINLISSFLYDLVSRYRRIPEKTAAKVTIFAEETRIKKTVKIEYEGPVSGLISLEKSIDHIFDK